MSKIFDPKITEEAWEFDTYGSESAQHIYAGSTIICEFVEDVDEPATDGDKKAILAVPQLLEVYKKAIKLLNSINKDGLFDSFGIFETKELEKAIKKLKQRHCKEN